MALGMNQLHHTFATIMMTGSVDIVTGKKLMGHSGPKMLMKVNTHAVNENMGNTIAVVGNKLFA